ncbi:MAG: hypothetical protein EAZ25_09695 [Oscillatoriales cyanobacterium]|nr:MAG: hypothetical protein EAZ25_09695 [Oscillatoriales cyanobacterium]
MKRIALIVLATVLAVTTSLFGFAMKPGLAWAATTGSSSGLEAKAEIVEVEQSTERLCSPGMWHILNAGNECIFETPPTTERVWRVNAQVTTRTEWAAVSVKGVECECQDIIVSTETPSAETRCSGGRITVTNRGPDRVMVGRDAVIR